VTYQEIQHWGSLTRGRPYRPIEIKSIMKEYDGNRSGSISLSEWLHWHEHHVAKDDGGASERFGVIEGKAMTVSAMEAASKLSKPLPGLEL